MMNGLSKIILVSGIFCFLSCEKDTIKPSEVYTYSDIEIKFIDFNDSRCPEDAVCFLAGEASVDLKISNDTESINFTLTGIGAATTLLNHKIVFVDLLPYPKIGDDQNDNKKELKLDVTKN